MISIRGLTKRYGALTALADLNLEVGPGRIFGLIGPNGAGKTTTIRILATLLRPTAGEVTIAGHALDREPAAIRRLIGYLPDAAGVYEDLLVDEYLRFFAAVAGVRGAQADRVVGDVLELTDLAYKRKDLVETLSRGMRQRLGVARALLPDPAVLLLDEPASGLDPRARVELRSLLKTLRGMGKTIIISSHILWELGELCDAVGILEAGRLVFSGPVEALLRQVRTGTVVHARVGPFRPLAPPEAEPAAEVAPVGEPADAPAEPPPAEPPFESKSAEGEADPPDGAHLSQTPAAGGESETALCLLREDPRVAECRLNADLLEIRLAENAADPSFIPPLLIGAGLHLHYFSEEPLSLEEAFLRLTADAAEA